MNERRSAKGAGRLGILGAARTCASALALTIATAAAGNGQTVPYSADASADFQTYRFRSPDAVGIERLSLSTLSFAAGAQPTDALRLELRGAYARGSLGRPDGSTTTLAGLTDTEIRADYALPGDRIKVTLGYLLPTGSTTHSFEEIQVAGAIASDLLPFRVSNWGTGGGLAAGAALVRPMGDFGVGLRLGYTLRRELTPFEDDDRSYRPGNEIRARLAVDRTIGTATKAVLALDLQRSSDDAIAGERAYRAGNWIQATGSVSFAAGWRSTGIAYLGALRRGAGNFVLETLDAPAMHLIVAGTGLRLPFQHGTVVPGVDMRLFRRSDGLGQGGLAGLGAAVELPTGSLVVMPSLRTRIGRLLMWEGADSSAWGIEFGFAVRGDARTR